MNSLLVRHARFAESGGHDERRGDSRHSVKSEKVAVLSVRNGRVCQIASHVAVSPSKAAHSVQRVADADVQAGTQPKIVAHVMQRSALIALLKGVERHDRRVRQRLCDDTCVARGLLLRTYRGRAIRLWEAGTYMASIWQRAPSGRVEGRLCCKARGFDRRRCPLCLWLRTQHARQCARQEVASR